MTRGRVALFGLVLAFAAAGATTSSAPVVNVTGSWTGPGVTDDQQLSGEFRLSLRQVDATVSGVLLMTGVVVPTQLNGYIDGSVAMDNFTFTRGPLTVSLKVQGSTMRGRIAGLASPASVDVYRLP